MNGSAIPLEDFDQEMATTRALLARVPDGKGEWKPHTKSFSLAHLAQLVATMPGWISQTLQGPFIDLAKQEPYSVQTTESLLQQFDRLVQSARDALTAVTGAALDERWALRHGGTELFAAPRGPVVRMHLRHLVHHRGQLTVYLRLLDVPLPSIYGPTADSPWGS